MGPTTELAASRHFIAAVDAIRQEAQSAEADHGSYRGGWARVPIRAPRGTPLAGYGKRDGARSLESPTQNYVRAFALAAGRHRLVIFAADLLLTSPDVVNHVRRALVGHIRTSRLFFTASHTHSGPGGFIDGLVWGQVFGPFAAESFRAVVSAHVEAAKIALSRLAPARIGFAERRVPGVCINRVEKNGPVDEHLWVLRIEHLQDKESAALWTYGCHPVTRGPDHMKISSDYPGDVARLLEGGRVDLLGFAAGGVGSSEPPSSGLEGGRRVARRLEPALVQALEAAKKHARTHGTIASAQLDLPSPPIEYRVAGQAIPGFVIAPFLRMPRLTFGAVAIQNAVLMHLPTELSGDLTKIARKRARSLGIRLAILPFNGTYLGYTVGKRVFELAAERRAAFHRYETETLSFLGTTGADYVLNVGLRLASGVKTRADERRPRRNP